MATTLSLAADVFAQLIVILYPPVLVFWLVIHLKIGYWRSIGKRAYWTAAAAWPLIGSSILFWRQSIFSIRWPNPWWLTMLGMIGLALSIRIGREAGKSIPLRTLVGLPELEPQRNRQPLLQSGIYSKTRNPIYVAHWLAIFAAAAVTGFAANWTLLAVDTIVLTMMVRAEERELYSSYGAEYDEYRRRVRRFV
jgi:protein-S-isoprenylcysteine O-methyltransferase Ste14